METTVQKWEYLKVIVDVYGKPRDGIVSNQFDQVLEQVGEKGWELVSAIPLNAYHVTFTIAPSPQPVV